MGMEYEKIHVYPNDCILNRKEFESLHKCPRYGVSRYRVKDDDSEEDYVIKNPPTKALWYLSIIPRFKRLFANVNDAKNLTWHVNGKSLMDCYDMLPIHHNGRKLILLFPEFGSDPRNFRLGLATDGMNPYNNLSSKHSLWLVLVIIYNLSYLLCMKRKYMMFSMMISGPRQLEMI